MDETKYYQDRITIALSKLGVKGFVTVTRWSYKENRMLLFPPFPIGELKEQEERQIKFAILSIDPKKLEKFSFTRLFVESERESWIHFKLAHAEQILYYEEEKLFEISCVGNASERFINLLIDNLRTNLGLTFSLNFDDVWNTFDSAIIGVLNQGITDIYFIPIMVPSKWKNFAGILAINSIGAIDNGILKNVLQPIASGLIGRFHLEEMDSIRLSYALRSAVAAIMARNMSHIHGSHIEPGLQHKMDTFEKEIKKRLEVAFHE